MHIRIRILFARLTMHLIQAGAVVIGVLAGILMVITDKRARKIINSIYLKPGTPHAGNCSAILMQQMQGRGWLLLHTSHMNPLITHVMYAEKLPPETMIVHFQPYMEEKKYGRITSVLKAMRHKGEWVQSTVGAWMDDAPKGWRE